MFGLTPLAEHFRSVLLYVQKVRAFGQQRCHCTTLMLPLNTFSLSNVVSMQPAYFEQSDSNESALARAMLFEWYSARCHLICALYGLLFPCTLNLRMDVRYGLDPQVVGLVHDDTHWRQCER